MNKLLGQHFTPQKIVEKMLGLRKNCGKVLEPSSGKGAFLNRLEKDAVAVEIDERLSNDSRIVVADFFEYSVRNKFDTVIGNPPYIRFRDIGKRTRDILPMDLFDGRSNLYLFFIAKCMEHLNPRGELIFITPRDFLKATSAKRLNESLYRDGSITHYHELGDAAIFDEVTPNCAIWRWEKGRKKRQMISGGKFQCRDGQVFFGPASKTRLGDFFEVKVGAVSGADDVFNNKMRGCTDMVCSTTVKDGETRRMIYNKKDKSLTPHKPRLLRRKIRDFNETNWWQWGRKFCERPGPRIYVNAKTRNANPFFISEVEAYDGSVIALFPKAGVDLAKAMEKLNKVNWEKMGFVCDGRFLFTQQSLETAPVEV